MKSTTDAEKIINLQIKNPNGLKKDQIIRKTALGSDASFYRALRTAKSMTNNGIFCNHGKYYISEDCYSSEENYLLLHDDELIALISVYHIISGMTSDILHQVVEPIRDKISRLVNISVKNPSKWVEKIRILDSHYRKFEKSVFLKIAQAIARERVIKFTYTDHSGNQSSRTVSPQQLVRYKDNWYLDGWCHNKEDLRIFSLDCITELKFDNMKYFTPNDSIIREIYGTSYGIFSGIPTGTAKIKLSGNAARYALREVWHPKQKTIRMGNGDILLEIPFNKTPELIGSILFWGEEAQVLSPASLRDEITSCIKNMLSIYQIKSAEQ